MADYIKPTTTSSKYTNFNILETVYKTVNKQDINAYIAISKNATPGKHPIIVKWHGGGYCTGSAMFEDWFPNWLITYIHDNNAILIAPNYRLLPESTWAEQFSDVTDFWSWMRKSLQPLLSEKESTNLFGPGIVADLDKVMVTGESAGGTLSVMSSMTQLNGTIKACVATYPGMLDFESEKFLAGRGNRRPFGVPLVPAAVFHEHVASMVPGKIVTSCDPPGRLPILFAQAQHGLSKPYFGDDESLFPLKLIEKVKDSDKGKVPYMLIIHGRDDTACDVELSYLFVEKAEKNLGKGRVEIEVQAGDHGFDTEIPLDTEWLKKCLKKPTAIWLGEAEV